MKYSSSNKPLVCMQTQSTCYKSTYKMQVKGILWHSTGANNPTIKRYVQPSDAKPAEDTYTKAEWLEILGKNAYNNDWNHTDVSAGLNCWIGKLADGSVTTVQTMPWDYRPWGCGSGTNGSCNNGWIQFEICEDGLTDSDYFNKIYQEACEITAYLCTLFDLDPSGTALNNGITVPVILCHKDSYNLGLGSNHSDVLHWFSKHGKTMADVREDVAALIASNIPDEPELPDEPDPPIDPDPPVDPDPDDPDPDEPDPDEPEPPVDPDLPDLPDEPEIPDFPVDIMLGVPQQSITVLSTTTSAAIIKCKTNKEFGDHIWSYRVTNLLTNKSSAKTKLTNTGNGIAFEINKLLPGTDYLVEVFAIDDTNSTVQVLSTTFTTELVKPATATSLDFNLASQQLTFTPPAIWGDSLNSARGYTVSVVINGQERLYSNSLVKYTNTTRPVLVDVSTLLAKVDIKNSDLIQVGVQPWIKIGDNLITAEPKPRYSLPTQVLVRPKRVFAQPRRIKAVYIKAQNKYKPVFIHLLEKLK